ncbi:MAG TPA: HEAT repeat domain-containing protein, partial [Verrucomicrobiae bacterium]|nr:HEAT repeat domain-containing protein [Verrucomicrobiae bacterium]
ATANLLDTSANTTETSVMIKRLKIVVVAVIIGMAICAGGIWLLAKTLEDRPSLYRGKPLNYWIAQANSHDAAAGSQAREYLTNKVVPLLIDKMLHDHADSRLKAALVEHLNGLPLIFINYSPASGRRAMAAFELGAIGPMARRGVPALIQVLKSQDHGARIPAANSLGDIHSDPDLVIPALIECLDDKLEDLPEAAASSLAKFGRQAKAAVPKLVKMLSNKEDDVRAAAAQALKQIDPQAAAKAGVK